MKRLCEDAGSEVVERNVLFVMDRTTVFICVFCRFLFSTCFDDAIPRYLDMTE